MTRLFLAITLLLASGCARSSSPADIGAIDATEVSAPHDADTPEASPLPRTNCAFPTYRDCDGDPSNNCETDTRYASEHCGACGRACLIGQRCDLGTCLCTRGSTTCVDRCVDLLVDALNCGACGHACLVGQRCERGTCLCMQDLTACGDRCVDLLVSTENCGACGRACAVGETCCRGVCADLTRDGAHCGRCGFACDVGSVCIAGRCVCPEGTIRCGYCADLLTDDANCGACSNRCSGNRRCTSGVCACRLGFIECGGTCVDTTVDAANCGACGRACATSEVCTSGRCGCTPMFTSCDGHCVNTLVDLANCGACGVACAGGARCTHGACSTPSIRQVAPMSTSRVTSHRPTLRWWPLPGSEGTLVELCRDRAMTRSCLSWVTTASSARPERALAPGTWFWRVRPRRSGTTDTEGSAVWQFRVGQGDASVDTVHGFDPDFDGDGFSDVVEEEPSLPFASGPITITRGGAVGIDDATTRTLDGFGVVHQSIGDTNGDGYGDLAVLQRINAMSDRVTIFFGGASGVATPSVEINLYGHRDGFSLQVGALGDVDRDGYGDIAVTRVEGGVAPGDEAPTRLYRGGPGGPDPDFTIAPRHATGDGFDVNGDGYPDVAAEQLTADAPVTQVFPGGPSGIGAIPLPGTPRGVPFGDFNGDGYADLGQCAATRSGDGTSTICVIYLGARDGAHSAAHYQFPVSRIDMRVGGGSQSLASSGASDTNGDGLADLLVGTRSVREGDQLLSFAVLGTAAATADGFMRLFAWPAVNVTPAPAGDVDGDGFDDVIVRVWATPDPTLKPIRGAVVFGASGASMPRRAQMLPPR